MDPKKAQKLGQAWGEVLTDSVFGIADVVKNAPAQKAANNQRVLNKNKITEINNQIVRQNNLLREQAMRELAKEAEMDALAKMTPKQREDYKQAKIAAEKSRVREQRLAKERHEEMMTYFWTFFIIFVVLPLVVWAGLLLYGIIISSSDYQAYASLKSWVPLLKTIVGR
jgi:hypothetical protein